MSAAAVRTAASRSRRSGSSVRSARRAPRSSARRGVEEAGAVPPRPRASGREQRRRVQEIADRLPGSVASYYEMLDVAPTAPADEIKRAFRREIAKYHPDKVQHLGREFQEIAAVKAAELTQAYKTLSDESLRADYDAQLKAGDDRRARSLRHRPRRSRSPDAPTPQRRRVADLAPAARRIRGSRGRQRCGAEGGGAALPSGAEPGIRPVRGNADSRVRRHVRARQVGLPQPHRSAAPAGPRRRRRSTPPPCRKAGRWRCG